MAGLGVAAAADDLVVDRGHRGLYGIAVTATHREARSEGKESKEKESSYETSLESGYLISGKAVKLRAGDEFRMKASVLASQGSADIKAREVNILLGVEEEGKSSYKREKDLIQSK